MIDRLPDCLRGIFFKKNTEGPDVEPYCIAMVLLARVCLVFCCETVVPRDPIHTKKAERLGRLAFFTRLLLLRYGRTIPLFSAAAHFPVEGAGYFLRATGGEFVREDGYRAEIKCWD